MCGVLHFIWLGEEAIDGFLPFVLVEDAGHCLGVFLFWLGLWLNLAVRLEVWLRLDAVDGLRKEVWVNRSHFAELLSEGKVVLLHAFAELQERLRQLDGLRLCLSEDYALVEGFLLALIRLTVSVTSVYVCCRISWSFHVQAIKFLLLLWQRNNRLKDHARWWL